MKNTITRLILLSLSIFIILLAGFYFLSLKPKLVLPGTLLKAEKILARNNLNLIQNRISLISFVSLDPEKAYFPEVKEQILQTLSVTNKKGLENLDKQFVPENITSIQNETVNFVNDELHPEIPKLFAENRLILERQQKIIGELIKIDDIVKNIFLYDPTTDLKSLHFINDKEEIIERSANAVEGLGRIKEKLSNWPDQNENITALIKKITGTQALFETLSTEVKDSEDSAGFTLDNIVKNFINMRQEALEAELLIIRSPKMVVLLKDQTNLIYKYDFWLNKIDEMQEEMKKMDFQKLF